MCKKLICLASFVLVLSLAGGVQAADIHWTDTAGDHLWSTPANWDIETIPISGNDVAGRVRIDLLPGPTIASEDAVAFNIRLGNNTTAAMTVDGGNLAVAGWIGMGRNDSGDGTLNMISGTLTAADFNLAEQKSVGTLNMTGGTIDIRDLKLGVRPVAR